MLRPRRETVVQRGPAELVRGPQADLLAQPGDVHRHHGRHEQELGHEVAVAHRVDRVGHHRVEAQVGGDEFGVQAQRRPGERPCPHGRTGGPPVPVVETLDIAQQGVGVLGQFVPERHRLRALQVGEAGRRVERVPLGLSGQRRREFERHLLQVARLIAQIQPEVGRHLIVAAAARPQPTAELGAEPLQQAPFDGGVDVLVSLGRQECPGRRRRQQPVETGQHRDQIVVRQQPGTVQGARVRLALLDVVRRQHPVEVHRQAQLGHGVGRPAREPAAPQPDLLGRLRPRHCWAERWSRAVARLLGSPHRSMKPLALDWSNVSPVS